MSTEELLKQIRIPPEYAHVWDTPPSDIADLSVRLESWRVGVSGPLSDLVSQLAISGSLSTEEQSLLIIHVAQYVGHDPWASSHSRSQAECTLLLHISVQGSRSGTDRHLGELCFAKRTINYPRTLQPSAAGVSIAHTP